jgi:DNA repair exonuclease SbcCD ATPase subunit
MSSAPKSLRRRAEILFKFFLDLHDTPAKNEGEVRRRAETFLREATRQMAHVAQDYNALARDFVSAQAEKWRGRGEEEKAQAAAGIARVLDDGLLRLQEEGKGETRECPACDRLLDEHPVIDLYGDGTQYARICSGVDEVELVVGGRFALERLCRTLLKKEPILDRDELIRQFQATIHGVVPAASEEDAYTAARLCAMVLGGGMFPVRVMESVGRMEEAYAAP